MNQLIDLKMASLTISEHAVKKLIIILGLKFNGLLFVQVEQE